MADRIVIYYDSITHRMLRLVNDYPDHAFTRGQLLAASEQPVVAHTKLTPIPPLTEATTGRTRSATVQLSSMLRNGLLTRMQDDGPRTRLDGSGIPQWFYKRGRVTLYHARVEVRPPSSMRPGMNVAT